MMPSSSSSAPAKRRIRVARMLSFVISVAIAASKILFAKDAIESPMSLFNGMMYEADNNDTSITKVLIVRTMSPSEIPIVIEDVTYVKSFYAGKHDQWMTRSRSRCPTLKKAGYKAEFHPYGNASNAFPNHLLCNSDEASSAENYYLNVRADFMLFARSEAYAKNVSATIELLSGEFHKNTIHDVNVDIRDVSLNPNKIWNWLLHCTEERLKGYEYVWFIDGDVSLKSLNWQAFWQQVKLLRPKIVQGASISVSAEGHSTVHNILRFKQDARLMAAEVPIVEVQAPLVEVGTWVAFRDRMAADPKPMYRFEVGGEQCFDMAWCHMAKNNMTGFQGDPPISNIGYHGHARKISLATGDNGDITGRACIVLYQTPIVHVSKYLSTDKFDFQVATQLLCRYFRLDLGVIGKQGLKKVYEFFNAPEM